MSSPLGIVRATLGSLAKLLSVKDDQIEDALASERLVKRTLNRRGLLLSGMTAVVASALPTGLALSQPRAADPIDGSILFLHRLVVKMAPSWGTPTKVTWNWVHPDGSEIRIAVQR